MAPFAYDSRGLTYLKLGDFGHALADYNAALELNPKLVNALYGRGIAKLRMGDTRLGNVDIEAAKAIRASVADEFAKNGISP